MKTFASLLVILGGCFKSGIGADKFTLSKQGSQDLACGTAPAEVVYYGLRGEDVQTSSPCFGDKATGLAVVECAGKRKAYWKTDGQWGPAPGEVTAVDAGGIEMSLAGAENTSGSVGVTARCSR